MNDPISSEAICSILLNIDQKSRECVIVCQGNDIPTQIGKIGQSGGHGRNCDRTFRCRNLMIYRGSEKKLSLF